MTSKPLTHDEYTVGWVCALPKELIAAAAMLDETHPDLPRQPNDHNAYSLGRVSGHNVVVACLPKGEIGNNNSAAVATRMTSTFPSIRFGLMVGIGGGVPKSVRLGDVVVSTPTDGFGGVVQWDFGKTEQGGTFKRTGALNRPPTELLAALTKLKKEHAMKGSKIPQYLEELKKNWPKLVPKYTRTESLKDVLFRADCKHVEKSVCDIGHSDNAVENAEEQSYDEMEDEEEGNHCINCDQTKIVRRKPREMLVRYGLIASGNQVIKDAAFRNEINTRLGGKVLCFEMEAAGLMNDFPCIVIRGICDYADSHKNKDWQEHAAAVAAAFAKELLSAVPAQEVQQMPMIKSICDRLEGVATGIDEVVSRQRDQEHQTALDWLTKVNYGLPQSDYLRRRQDGTGQWLLDSTEFQAWVETGGQTLFCQGIPGAGKTILTAVVIDNLTARFSDDATIGIGYIYCNFRRQHEQKLEDLLLSLLKQLVQRWPSMVSGVKVLYDKHKGKGTRPSYGEVLRVLHSVVTIFSRVFIIVDALDECQAPDGCRSKFLSSIFELQAESGANLFVTSRFIPEIMEKFKGRSIYLEIRAHDEDVRMYLQQQLPSSLTCSPELQEDIVTEIIQAVDGMFLLAELHLQSLLGRRSPKAVRKVLHTLRKESKVRCGDNSKLDLAYDQAVERIKYQPGDGPTLAKEVLSWITFAKRPLSKSELQHALAVEVGEPELDRQNLPQIEYMVSVCAGLVTVDEESGIIRLVHYTTQEYLETHMFRLIPGEDSTTSDARKNEIAMVGAHRAIAIICVNYLSFSVFEGGFCQTDDEFEERLRLYPLYNYAANNWGHHTRKISTLYHGMMEFLEDVAKVEASSQALMVSKQFSWYSGNSQHFPKRMTGLHLAAYFGISEAANTLLRHGQSPDLKDSYGRTPLSFAAEKGHEAGVRLLLEKGANVEPKNGHGRTPLSFAAENGDEAVVRLLLEKGANLEPEISYGLTPLSWAARQGHEAVVRLLLEKGANLELENNYGQTPLSLAAASGREAVVRLLLEKGANLEPKNGYGRTPLSWAAEKGHEAVVKMLLEKGANMETKNGYGQTPLSWAAEKGHEAVVKLLLEKGADMEAEDNSGQTSLSWAAENGHETVVKLLLEKGAKLEPKDNIGQTPLSGAAENGHRAVVKLLLEKGANMEAEDNIGQTPLSRAAENGHKAVVKLLLEKGADLEPEDNNGQRPLLRAEERKHILALRMRDTTSMSQRTLAAQELDLLEGNHFLDTRFLP
ncbi:hypothetical protein DL765_004451 [Monosporascus sp. GIB2]|nr:hypothetical protein DL765_004451 [Monosporascus sp. GIB2]